MPIVGGMQKLRLWVRRRFDWWGREVRVVLLEGGYVVGGGMECRWLWRV